MEKANFHATKAQEYETMRDFENAISHYFKAAQYYLEAVEFTTDSNVQNTLRKCHFKALNDARILQKKMKNVSIPLENSDSNSSQIEDLAKFSGFIGQSSSEEIGIFKLTNKPSSAQSTLPAQIKIDESTINSRLGNYNSETDDTFNAYILPNSSFQTDNQAWIQDDPFVRFWDKVENLVDYLPLNLKKTDRKQSQGAIGSNAIIGKQKNVDNSNVLLQSYYFVPSKKDQMPLKTLEEFEIENKTLKQTIEKLSSQVASLENVFPRFLIIRPQKKIAC